MKKKTAWILAGLCLVPGLSVSTAAAAAQMKARIVDDVTGQALAARVAVTNAEGKFVEIAGTHPHVQVLGKRWCYVDGSFTVLIPDSGAEISLGSSRAYGQVKDQADYGGWLAAIKAGRSFVTNGPILEFDADGQQAGVVVEFQGTRRVKVRVAARSILPFNTLEIVANGRTIGHKSIATQNNPPKDGLTSMEVTATVDLDQSTWLAGRVVDNPDLRNNIMPRGASVFAHTAPVYFLKEGRKVRDPASIAYLIKYVQGTLHWLSTHPKFTTEQEWKDAQNSAEQALKVYQGL